MSVWPAFFIYWAFAAIVVTLIWLYQLKTKNATFIDPGWSLLVGGWAVWDGFIAPGDATARWAVGLMGGLWGLRLGTHLLTRALGHDTEDTRYAKLRYEWGGHANRNMFLFFQFQVVIAALLSAPFAANAWRGDTPAVGALVGAGLIWVVAVVGEGIADAQLSAFTKDKKNKGKTCTKGLWSWSRHPNYFFECVHWLAYVVLGIGLGWGAWALTLLGPIVMWFLLIKVSGVPVIERDRAKKNPEYAEYMRTTSQLIPLPPKKKRAQ